MELPEKGIITTRNWIMASDGERYMYLYSEEWRIIKDKEFPLTDFHSRERWSLLAINNDKIVCLIPGCEVCGFVAVNKCPEKTGITPHKVEEPDISPGIFNLTEGKGYK